MLGAYAQVLAERFSVAMLPWHGAGLAAVGPWFFSAVWWSGAVQHELALMPVAGEGKGGK